MNENGREERGQLGETVWRAGDRAADRIKFDAEEFDNLTRMNCLVMSDSKPKVVEYRERGGGHGSTGSARWGNNENVIAVSYMSDAATCQFPRDDRKHQLA